MQEQQQFFWQATNCRFHESRREKEKRGRDTVRQGKVFQLFQWLFGVHGAILDGVKTDDPVQVASEMQKIIDVAGMGELMGLCA